MHQTVQIIKFFTLLIKKRTEEVQLNIVQISTQKPGKDAFQNTTKHFTAQADQVVQTGFERETLSNLIEINKVRSICSKSKDNGISVFNLFHLLGTV